MDREEEREGFNRAVGDGLEKKKGHITPSKVYGFNEILVYYITWRIAYGYNMHSYIRRGRYLNIEDKYEPITFYLIAYYITWFIIKNQAHLYLIALAENNPIFDWKSLYLLNPMLGFFKKHSCDIIGQLWFLIFDIYIRIANIKNIFNIRIQNNRISSSVFGFHMKIDLQGPPHE
ncbi:hypothetical protein ACJX0J_022516, partial [Zea mays]